MDNPMKRKLSDILIEIAMQGLKNPRFGHSEVMHPLMLLSSIAWNRAVGVLDYAENYKADLEKFTISKTKLRKELVSTDWDIVLQRMIEYKQARFPDDKRYITLCAYTPHGSLRVEWDPSTDEP